MAISTKRKLAILRNQAEQLNLHIRHNDLDVVQCTKYLGVHIDNTLDWKNHIQEVSKKISRSLGLIRYAKRFYLLSHLKIFTLVWLIHIFATVAQSGVSVDLLNYSNYRSFRIAQPE